MDGEHNGNPGNTHICFKASKGFQVFSACLGGWWFDHPRTRSLRRIWVPSATVLAAFWKVPFWCGPARENHQKKGAAFYREWGEEDFFGGEREMFCFFLGGKDFRFMKKFMGHSWDQEGLEHVLFFYWLVKQNNTNLRFIKQHVLFFINWVTKKSLRF